MCRCRVRDGNRLQSDGFECTQSPMSRRSSMSQMSRKRNLQSFESGPFRTFAPPSRCCGRSPHCRHSLHPQSHMKVGLTHCGTSLPFSLFVDNARFQNFKAYNFEFIHAALVGFFGSGNQLAFLTPKNRMGCVNRSITMASVRIDVFQQWIGLLENRLCRKLR